MDNDIESQITRMIIEMNSGHNDGWVSNHYRERLERIKKLVDGALKGNKNAKKR